jgi:membrane protein implicated in regulation of membrane protease activity
MGMSMTWENLSRMENVFLGCAIVGGGLFLLRSIVMVIGLGSDDHHGGADGDMAGDHGSPIGALKLVTIHGLTAFLSMFGLIGFLMLRNSVDRIKKEALDTVTDIMTYEIYHAPKAVWIASIVATVAGVIAMVVSAKIFHSAQKLQSDGTIYPKDIIGVEGSVYLAIRAGCIGKVQLTARDALKVFDARSKDPAVDIKTGSRVKVVDIGDVLIVEPI